MGTRTFPRMSPPYTRRSGWYASTEFRNLRRHTSEPCKSLTKNIRCVPTRKPSAMACHIVHEDVLERLLEDLQELNEQTKKEIEQAVRDVKAGKYRTHQQLKDELGF